MINKKNNKAQHEIAGFVLIVLIVSVIGVIFLMIYIGNGNVSEYTSLEVSNLLGSSMYSTTSCSKGYESNYQDMQDLVKNCYKDDFNTCFNGKKICDVLKEDLKKIIDKGLNVGVDGVNKAYKLEAYYKAEDDETPNEYIMNFSEGDFKNCSAIVGGSHLIPISSLELGNLKLELDVCKSS
jgi:hypothetical protein